MRLFALGFFIAVGIICIVLIIILVEYLLSKKFADREAERQAGKDFWRVH